MSTFKHPVGPQPSRVYWRRRLVLLIALVAVVVVIVLIVVRPGSSSGETPKPATTTSAKPTAAATSIPTSSADASGQECDPSSITVGAVTDASTYAAGQLPQEMGPVGVGDEQHTGGVRQIVQDEGARIECAIGGPGLGGGSGFLVAQRLTRRRLRPRRA